MLLSPLLQEYLIENGSLPLPATGKLTIQNTPAYLKAGSNIFVAPDCRIDFADTMPSENELQQLTAFIAVKLNIPGNESQQLLEKEIKLNAEPEQESSINWPEWNLFQTQKHDGDLQPSTLDSYLPAFAIEKIVRQPITVVDILTQPAETELIETVPEVYAEYEEPVTKDYWWVWALVIFVVSVLLILFRYG